MQVSPSQTPEDPLQERFEGVAARQMQDHASHRSVDAGPDLQQLQANRAGLGPGQFGALQPRRRNDSSSTYAADDSSSRN
jgi:hypothetical protein